MLNIFPGGGCPVSWLCSPGGPNTPFRGPYFIVADSLRLLCLFGAAVVLLYTWGALMRCRTFGQHARFVALALFVLSATGAEISHIGDYMSYRLFLNVTGTLFAAFGVYHFQRESPTHDFAKRKVGDSDASA